MKSEQPVAGLNVWAVGELVAGLFAQHHGATTSAAAALCRISVLFSMQASASVSIPAAAFTQPLITGVPFAASRRAIWKPNAHTRAHARKHACPHAHADTHTHTHTHCCPSTTTTNRTIRPAADNLRHLQNLTMLLLPYTTHTTATSCLTRWIYPRGVHWFGTGVRARACWIVCSCRSTSFLFPWDRELHLHFMYALPWVCFPLHCSIPHSSHCQGFR